MWHTISNTILLPYDMVCHDMTYDVVYTTSYVKTYDDPNYDVENKLTTL